MRGAKVHVGVGVGRGVGGFSPPMAKVAPRPIRNELPEIMMAPEVTQEWQRAIKADKPYRVLLLHFQGEILHLLHKLPTSPSPVKDFESIKELVSEREPCYVLFRNDDANVWSLISYIPEDAMAKHQDKMVYAVAKNSIKNKFGVGYFGDEWHVTSKPHFTYAHYKTESSRKGEAALSETEKIVANGIKEEEKERLRLMAAPNHPFGKTAITEMEMTLSPDIIRELNSFKDGRVDSLRLGIDAKENIKLEDSKNGGGLTLEDIKNTLKTASTPGFYLFSLRNGAGVPSTIFLYYCPEKSPHNMRLQYATRMKGIREKIARTPISFTKVIELQDARDLDSHFNSRPSFEADVTSKQVNRATPPPSKIASPHPLFGGAPGSSPKKRIVIPPPAAYQ